MQLEVGIAARGAFEAKIDAILPDVMSLRIRSSCRRRKFEPQLLIFDGETLKFNERIAKSITV